jgi:hypothetical protein
MREGIQDHPDLVKDTRNRAVLNTNAESLRAYKMKRKKDKHLAATLDDINTLKSEMSEIKSLLTELINAKN